MKFVLGFGKAMTIAMESYIHDHRHLLQQKKPVTAATA
jgi:hypothetical protein